MAGNYPDVPAPRMAYDRDGTVGFIVSTGGSVTQMSQPNLATLNNESTDSVGGGVFPSYYGLLFPQPRDVSGIFLTRFSPWNRPVETSVDTTNGLDGTWTAQGNFDLWTNGDILLRYRTEIANVAWVGVKAFRVNLGGQGMDSAAIHAYGSISSGETPDRVRMWHPTLDEPLDDNTSADGAHFDWGDIQQNTSSDKTFRIKNNSATMTANSVIVSQETLTDTTPVVNSMFTFSDGGAFAASIDIGNLAPGALSPVITKRFDRPSNASLSLWTSRTIADPTSWT